MTRTAAALTVLVLGCAALQVLFVVAVPPTEDERIITSLGWRFVHEGRLETEKDRPRSHSPAGMLVPTVFGITQLGGRNIYIARALCACLTAGCGIVLALALRHAVPGAFWLWYLASFWLAPWTIYNGTLAWEPALALALGAVVPAAALGLRLKARPLPSCALAWSLGAAFQVHGQFLIAMLTVVFLSVRRLIRWHWWTALAGLAVAGLTLMPFGSGVPLNPARNAVDEKYTDAHIGFGLVKGYPLLRAVGYWLRGSSADLNRQMRLNRLYNAPADTAGGVLKRVMARLLVALALISVVFSAAANWWFFRQSRHESEEDAVVWLRAFASASFLSVLIAAALSPLCIQSWHVVIALPAACIPFAAWCGHLWASSHRRSRALVVALFALRAASCLLVALGFDPGAGPTG